MLSFPFFFTSHFLFPIFLRSSSSFLFLFILSPLLLFPFPCTFSYFILFVHFSFLCYLPPSLVCIFHIFLSFGLSFSFPCTFLPSLIHITLPFFPLHFFFLKVFCLAYFLFTVPSSFPLFPLPLIPTLSFSSIAFSISCILHYILPSFIRACPVFSLSTCLICLPPALLFIDVNSTVRPSTHSTILVYSSFLPSCYCLLDYPCSQSGPVCLCARSSLSHCFCLPLHFTSDEMGAERRPANSGYGLQQYFDKAHS